MFGWVEMEVKKISVFILTDWQKSQGLVGLVLVGW